MVIITVSFDSLVFQSHVVFHNYVSLLPSCSITYGYKVTFVSIYSPPNHFFITHAKDKLSVLHSFCYYSNYYTCCSNTLYLSIRKIKGVERLQEHAPTFQFSSSLWRQTKPPLDTKHHNTIMRITAMR